MALEILTLQHAPILAQQLQLVANNIQLFGPPILTALVLNSFTPNWFSESIQSSNKLVKIGFNYLKRSFYNYRTIYKAMNNANLSRIKREQENYADKCNALLEVDPVFQNKNHFKIFLKDDIVNPDIIEQATKKYSEHGSITFEQVDDISNADIVFTETISAPENHDGQIVLGLSNFFYKALNMEEKAFLESLTDIEKVYEYLKEEEANKDDYFGYAKTQIEHFSGEFEDIKIDHNAKYETIKTQTRQPYSLMAFNEVDEKHDTDFLRAVRENERLKKKINNYQPLHTTLHEMTHLITGGYHPQDLSTMNPLYFARVLDLRNELNHQSVTVLSYKSNYENDNAELKICDAVNIANRFGPNLANKGQDVTFDLLDETIEHPFSNSVSDVVLTTKGGDGVFDATKLTDENTNSVSISMDEGFLPTRVDRFSHVVNLYNGPNTKIKTLNCGNIGNRIYLTGSHSKTINLSSEERAYSGNNIVILGDNPCDTVINNFNPQADRLEIRNFGNNYQDYITEREMQELKQSSDNQFEKFNNVYHHDYSKETSSGMEAFEQSYKDKYELTEQTIDGHKSTVLKFSDRKIVLNNVALEEFKKHLADREMPGSDTTNRTPLIRHNVFELKLNTFEDYERTNHQRLEDIIGVKRLLRTIAFFRMFTPHNILKRGVLSYEARSKSLYPAIFVWNQAILLANASLIALLCITSVTAFSLIHLYTDIKKQPILSMIFKPVFFIAKYTFKAISYCFRPLTSKVTSKMSKQYEKNSIEENTTTRTKTKYTRAHQLRHRTTSPQRTRRDSACSKANTSIERQSKYKH